MHALGCADFMVVDVLIDVTAFNSCGVLIFVSLVFFYSAKEKINVYACDCSAEALERVKDNLVNADVVSLTERFHAFCCDFSATEFPNWLACQSCRNTRFEKLPNCDLGKII